MNRHLGLVLAACIGLSGLNIMPVALPGVSPVLAEVLNASVQFKKTEFENTQAFAGGEIVSATTHQPVPQAVITIPALGLRFTADAQGRFALPTLPDKPIIIQVAAPGYALETRTLRGQPPGGMKIALSASRQMIQIDSVLRHLGDNQYAAASAGARQFQGTATGPMLSVPFYLPNEAGNTAVLHIGSVVGLDTQRAQQLGQSQLAYNSSPSLVRLNGVQVAALTVNGDRQRVQVPLGVLRPGMMNTVEVEAGYHTPGGTRIDFDDFELMSIRLEL